MAYRRKQERAIKSSARKMIRRGYPPRKAYRLAREERYYPYGRL